MANENLFESNEILIQSCVTASTLIDCSNSMHDGGVVPATEVATYLFKAEPGVFTSQIHSHLSWKGDRFITTL